jgi:hypothetical protein
LRGAFRERERLPRLEWIEEAAPLSRLRSSAPGWPRSSARAADGSPPEEVTEPETGDATVQSVGPDDLRALSDIQRVAFGGEPLPADAEPQAPSGGAVLARIGGEPVSAAAWTPVLDGHSEIVGVATAEKWRRRGSPAS